MSKNGTGAVMVVGGGIAGMQASLDLADSGYYVYLVESSSSIGGMMSQLDKTFPTGDCSMCMISPKMVELGRHLNIDIHTLAEVESVEGEPGNFTVKVKQKPRYVDPDKCTGCGICEEKCPKKTSSEYEQGLTVRKAIFSLFPQALPNTRAIDRDICIYFKNGKLSTVIFFQRSVEIFYCGSIVGPFNPVIPSTKLEFGYIWFLFDKINGVK